MMRNRPRGPKVELTAERARELFDYDAESGDLIRRSTGQPVGWYANGYLSVEIDDWPRRVHVVIWLHVHGELPNGDIDHINHDRADNRLVNLRVVTRSENARNARRSPRNTSGHTGVYWDKRLRKWHAQIREPGKTVRYLGVYNDLAEAVRARKAAEERYGYHPNHGQEVCH